MSRSRLSLLGRSPSFVRQPSSRAYGAPADPIGGGEGPSLLRTTSQLASSGSTTSLIDSLTSPTGLSTLAYAFKLNGVEMSNTDGKGGSGQVAHGVSGLLAGSLSERRDNAADSDDGDVAGNGTGIGNRGVPGKRHCMDVVPLPTLV